MDTYKVASQCPLSLCDVAILPAPSTSRPSPHCPRKALGQWRLHGRWLAPPHVSTGETDRRSGTLVPGAAPTAALDLGRIGVAWNDLFVLCVQNTWSFALTDSCIVWFFFLTVSLAFLTKNKRLHSILEILNADEIWEKLQNNTLQIDVQPRHYGDCASWIFKFRKEFVRGKKPSVRRYPF